MLVPFSCVHCIGTTGQILIHLLSSMLCTRKGLKKCLRCLESCCWLRVAGAENRKCSVLGWGRERPGPRALLKAGAGPEEEVLQGSM